MVSVGSRSNQSSTSHFRCNILPTITTAAHCSAAILSLQSVLLKQTAGMHLVSTSAPESDFAAYGMAVGPVIPVFGQHQGKQHHRYCCVVPCKHNTFKDEAQQPQLHAAVVLLSSAEMSRGNSLFDRSAVHLSKRCRHKKCRQSLCRVWC